MAVEASATVVTRQHLAEVWAIERASFKDPWPPSAFTAELSHPWSWFRGIGPAGSSGELGRVDGFIISWMLPQDMHLLNLAVKPVFRRRGLARALLADALAGFAAAGGGVASLEVRPSNPAARALYASFGFVPVGVRRRYYRRDLEDAIVMTCQVVAQRAEPARTGSTR